MTVFEALLQGFGRVRRAKRFMAWIYLCNLLLALLLVLPLTGLLRESLGHSLAAEQLRRGFNPDWFAEFQAEASGLGASLDPSVVGIGAVLNGLEAFLTGDLFRAYAGVVAVGALYLLLWTFFAGGVLDFYNSTAPPDRETFLSACARYFPRFLRLALFAALCYYLIYSRVLEGLGGFVSERLRDVVDERVAFLWTAAKYLVVLFLLAAVNMVFDYARILTVIENRRSMLLALLRSIRMMGTSLRPAGLYLLVTLVGLVFLGIYGLLPNKPWEQTWRGVTVTLAAGQLYILTRIWTRLLFYASQSALCSSLTAPAPPSRPPVPDAPEAPP